MKRIIKIVFTFIVLVLLTGLFENCKKEYITNNYYTYCNDTMTKKYSKGIKYETNFVYWNASPYMEVDFIDTNNVKWKYWYHNISPTSIYLSNQNGFMTTDTTRYYWIDSSSILREGRPYYPDKFRAIFTAIKIDTTINLTLTKLK